MKHSNKMSINTWIEHWLENPEGPGGNRGAMRFQDNCIWTYDTLLAVVDRQTETAVVNVGQYSVTSSGHRNRLLKALQVLGWGITHTPSETMLKLLTEGNGEVHAD